jgi:hypothetical protein
MATLKERLSKDLVEALKAKMQVRVTTLRLLNSAIHNREIDLRAKQDGKEGVLSDEEVLAVLKTEAKKRKEAIDLYEKGGRAELAEKEKQELEVIEGYLPAEMSDGELEELVVRALSELKPSGPADFGKVMGVIMKKVEGLPAQAGRASGDRVKKVIQEKLKSGE